MRVSKCSSGHTLPSRLDGRNFALVYELTKDDLNGEGNFERMGRETQRDVQEGANDQNHLEHIDDRVRKGMRGTVDRSLRKLLSYRVLIVGEIGFLPLDREGTHLFFQVVSRRYERGSTIYTSSKSYAEWGEVLGDNLLASAVLDRVLHHSLTVNIKGESYRLQSRRKAGLAYPPPARISNREK